MATTPWPPPPFAKGDRVYYRLWNDQIVRRVLKVERVWNAPGWTPGYWITADDGGRCPCCQRPYSCKVGAGADMFVRAGP